MKFKTLSICLLAIFLLGTGNPEVYAQRKATKKATTSTTKKKTTTTATTKATGPALVKANLANNKIIGWIDLENDPNEGLTYFELTLKENSMKLYMYEFADFDGTWSVSGNALNVRSSQGSITLALTSKDGGKSFSGTFTNHYAKKSREMVAYNVTAPKDETLDLEQFVEDIKNNKYIYYLGMYRGDDDPEIGIPVNVSFDFDDDDEDTGTFKVLGNSKFLTAIGAIKSDFEFFDDKLVYYNIKGEEQTLTFAKTNPVKFFLKMGYCRVPKYNNISLILYFIKKP